MRIFTKNIIFDNFNSMNIPFFNYQYLFKSREKKFIEIITDIGNRGAYILQKDLEEFEENLSKYIGVKYALGVANGTDAIWLALLAADIGKGDEVIFASHTYIATANAIKFVGAEPIPADCKPDHMIDPSSVRSLITSKTKAIVPTQLNGRCCDMDELLKIANENNLIIIEDAAQGMGSYYNNQHAGTFGDIAAFSAHPLKNLNAVGDGGFIITNKKQLYDKIKLLRTHGIKRRDYVEIFGVNSRLDSLNAEILSYRLKKLKKIITKRRYNVKLYKKFLNTDKVILPEDNSNTFDSYVMMVSKCENRNELQKFLAKKNIPSLVYYGTPLHLHKASKNLGFKKNSLPIAENIAKKVLSFPHHQYMNENQIKFICDNINKFYEKN